MGDLKKHIVFKTITLLIAIAFLIPSAVKFSHIFTHHTHKVCEGEQTTHIHKVDIDCDFYKFKLNNNYLNVVAYNSSFQLSEPYKIKYFTYKFLYNHRTLSFSLRGPPFLV